MKLPENTKLVKANEAFDGLVCLHKTHELKQAKSILNTGFNLKKFGHTAKLFGAPEFLVKYDPIAVFASPSTCHSILSGDPYVEFKLKQDARVLVHSLDAGGIKRELHELLSPKNQSDFSIKLKAMGIDAICHSESQNEVIVINPDVIELIQGGLYNETTLEARYKASGADLSR